AGDLRNLFALGQLRGVRSNRWIGLPVGRALLRQPICTVRTARRYQTSGCTCRLQYGFREKSRLKSPQVIFRLYPGCSWACDQKAALWRKLSPCLEIALGHHPPPLFSAILP